MKLQNMGAVALALAMLTGLNGCGTLRPQSVGAPSLCLSLGRELAAARTPQQEAETKEAGVSAGCWKRN